MAETQVHAAEIIRLIQTLRDRYADRPDVYVWGNLLLYYEEGNPRASVAPDVFVALGAAREPARRIYKLWEEGAPPTFVIEVTSPSTRREDLGRKRALYARLGVTEYVLYDPLGEYLEPAVQGFALDRGEYRPMRQDRDGALISRALALRLLLVDGRLRLLDGVTGASLLSPEERAAEAEVRIADAEGAPLPKPRCDGVQSNVSPSSRPSCAAASLNDPPRKVPPDDCTGSMRTPGLRTPSGSSACFAARRATAKGRGRSWSYQGRCWRPAAEQRTRRLPMSGATCTVTPYRSWQW